MGTFLHTLLPLADWPNDTHGALKATRHRKEELSSASISEPLQEQPLFPQLPTWLSRKYVLCHHVSDLFYNSEHAEK